MLSDTISARYPSRAFPSAARMRVRMRTAVLVRVGSQIVNSFFGGFVAYGSLTRTKVAKAAGATSQIAGLVTCLVVLLTMLVLLPLFKFLPKGKLPALRCAAAPFGLCPPAAVKTLHLWLHHHPASLPASRLRCVFSLRLMTQRRRRRLFSTWAWASSR